MPWSVRSKAQALRTARKASSSEGGSRILHVGVQLSSASTRSSSMADLGKTAAKPQHADSSDNFLRSARQGFGVLQRMLSGQGVVKHEVGLHPLCRLSLLRYEEKTNTAPYPAREHVIQARTTHHQHCTEPKYLNDDPSCPVQRESCTRILQAKPAKPPAKSNRRRSSSCVTR